MNQKEGRHPVRSGLCGSCGNADAMLNADPGAGSSVAGFGSERGHVSTGRRGDYGGMKAEEAKRLTELEEENNRFKGIVTEQQSDIKMPKHLGAEAFIGGKLVGPCRKRGTVERMGEELDVCFPSEGMPGGRSAAQQAA
jgi:putative transposase